MNVSQRILHRIIKGMRPGSSKIRALALLNKYQIFDKKIIQQQLKQLEGPNVLLFTPKQSN